MQTENMVRARKTSHTRYPSVSHHPGKDRYWKLYKDDVIDMHILLSELFSKYRMGRKCGRESLIGFDFVIWKCQ
jgi:hypothetical protein